jgi:hypothetical protein
MMVTDQVAISAAVARRPDRFVSLERTYNYNLHRRPFYSGGMDAVDLPDLVHVHYHQWFNRRNVLRDLQPPLDPDTEQYRWLDGELPLEPAIKAPLPIPGRRRSRWRGRRLGKLRAPLRQIGGSEK